MAWHDSVLSPSFRKIMIQRQLHYDWDQAGRCAFAFWFKHLFRGLPSCFLGRFFHIRFLKNICQKDRGSRPRLKIVQRMKITSTFALGPMRWLVQLQWKASKFLSFWMESSRFGIHWGKLSNFDPSKKITGIRLTIVLSISGINLVWNWSFGRGGSPEIFIGSQVSWVRNFENKCELVDIVPGETRLLTLFLKPWQNVKVEVGRNRWDCALVKGLSVGKDDMRGE